MRVGTMTRPRTAVVALALAAAVLATGCGAQDTASCPRTLIPLYVAPSDASWDRLAALSPRAAGRITVVVNPENGPGSVRREDYARRIAQARARGVRVLGYVATGYGARPAADVLADVDAYRRWYAPDGIFLDEGAPDAGRLAHYRELAAALRAAALDVVLNPGLVPDAGYLEVADTLVVFEGVPAEHDRDEVPDWIREAGPSRIAHLVHSAGDAAPAAARSTAVERGAGFVYVTDDGGANPWDTLATGFEREAAVLADCALPD
jgi:hypothetical protein